MASHSLRHRLHSRRLTVRLVLAILLVSSAITIVITAWQLMLDYRRDVDLLQQRIESAEESFARTLGASLWGLDQEQVRLQLRGLLELPHVDRVELAGDLNMRLGERSRYNHRRSFSFPIRHRTYDGRHHELGTLRLDVSLEQIHRRLIDRLLVIVGTQAIKTFLVSAALLTLFFYLVTRHLQTLAGFASGLRLHHLDRRVALNRPAATGPLRPDELDELAAALNFASERIGQDLVEREQIEGQRRLLAEALEQCPSGIVLMDAHGRMMYANPRFEQISGDSAAALNGRHLFGRADSMESRIHVLHGSREPWQELQQTGEWHGDIRLRRRDGQFRWAHLSLRRITLQNSEQFVGLFEDTTRLHQTQAQLDVQTYFHPLTELPNRLAMFEKLSHALRQHPDRPIAVAFLDIDNFKLVNDGLGHEAGDTVIREMAARLAQWLPDHWKLGHFSGDEFILVSSAGLSPATIEAQLGELLERIREPIQHADRELFVSASAGVAINTVAGNKAEDLFRAADAALHSAKQGNRGGLRSFEPAFSQLSFRRLTMESDLRKALAEGQLDNFYQPIFTSQRETIASVEALVRWHHPKLGLVSPAAFIPLAEETGLIIPLGEWVLRKGLVDLVDLRRWTERPDLRLSVNVSAQQVMHPGFIETVRQALNDHGLAASALQLEITEEVFLQDLATSRDTLTELHALGIRLAVDDFGTGYSALSYFKRMPIDCMKIDQSFIRDMFLRDRDLQLVGAVVSLAHGLGMAVVAEGVETEEQRAHLQLIGCEYLQGFLLARPMPVDELTPFLKGRRADV
ncbi:EAL domain-containing protein [Methylonatrum kenyense]|uniref:bifunctional diguanylate cyclase/phosphodiesterase n=1 Tax=Methylonatrum kenyense TaxID=455253 RepID=UPI0020BEABE0|nr:EAL domain-containing protein [Methylonatrum kenyense]MCK8515613.1 EAL domain-containing protein [Methylonatrum kenyense]